LKLVGLDIAYINNGYVYHTQFDRPEMIPPGCIQMAGEFLAVVVVFRYFYMYMLLSPCCDGDYVAIIEV